MFRIIVKLPMEYEISSSRDEYKNNVNYFLLKHLRGPEF